MNKSLFRFFSLLIWAALGTVLYSSWDDLVKSAEEASPKNGVMVVSVAAILTGFALLVILGKLADLLVKPEEQAPSRPVSKAEVRAEAEKTAEEALSKGDKTQAMRIYEGADMLNKAVEIAREVGDKTALARLYTKLGHHDRARRYHVELKNFEAAAQGSTLLGEIPVARELYKEAAAAREGEGLTPAVIAGLWDRAGDYATAAHLYEADQEWEHAAECYDLIYDRDNAKRCAESGRVFRALERRRGGFEANDPGKAEFKQNAEMREAIGDFLGAGFFYREADQMLEAAIVFEKYQEWERAARAYDKAGLSDRAAMARMNIKDMPKLEPLPPEPSSQTGTNPSSQSLTNPLGQPPMTALPSAAPAPGMTPQQAFRPLAEHVEYVPVKVPMGAITPVSGEIALKIAQRVRRGNFAEAAQFAMEANDWLMAAALYEQAGDLDRAAEIYRSIGKVNDAMFCLERAKKPGEAAMLSMAAGDMDRSVKLLAEAVHQGNEPELGNLLGEVLIQRGRYSEALELLRVNLAPEGVNAKTAELFYRYGRRFEDRNSAQEALGMYRALLEAGAQNQDLAEREIRLSKELGEEPKYADRVRVPAAGQGEGTQLAFADDALNTPGEVSVSGFEFVIPADLAVSTGEGGQRTTMARPHHQVSLFGEPALAAAQDGSLFELDSVTTAAANASPKGKSAGPVDPFTGASRYLIRGELARGGMGIIYEAEDTALGRDVALKIIQSDDALPEEYQQFLLEARAIARLSHPNVVMIYDIGLMDLKHYITMELIRGMSLDKWVALAGGQLSIKEAVRVFVEMSKGLLKAHDSGIVHRDIKPGNVLVSNEKEVKIVDFGLAKLGAGGEDHSGETIFKMSGTPGYMAPETIQGGESLPRADIYALGITLFYMIVGRPPHLLAGKTKPRQIAAFQLSGQLPSMREFRPEVPEVIDQIYQYSTAATPEERYQSISDYLPTVEQWYQAIG